MTRRGAWLASVAVAAGLTGWAAARPETSTPFDAKKFAGDQLARMAIGRLRAVPEPGIADYRIAALTLRMVRPLVGEDLELLRLELEAWSGAGDTARFDETLREVVKADPSDTVAQLRLIVSRIRELQNSDDRLNAYLKILGSKGKALHATVRSQLALDAALLARENGNQAAFIELMTQAAQLDPTNKDAVSLFVTYFIDRTTDPLEKVKLLTDVVAADPTDHSATMNLTHALMSCGAWKAAARTLPLSNMAYAATGGRPDAQRFIDGMIITWRAE
ncbi:MAG TPA: hypothetical protein VG797_06000, partial [Phycisphaerales bacterium]|nr:hypothetical protein [Phycisphaerales bacterium]